MKLTSEQVQLNVHPDFDKISLMPDMFKTGTFNVFFFEEEIGSIQQSNDKWLATPYGTTHLMGSWSQEGAIKHLIEVRNASPTKKEATALLSNQTKLF